LRGVLKIGPEIAGVAATPNATTPAIARPSAMVL